MTRRVLVCAIACIACHYRIPSTAPGGAWDDYAEAIQGARPDVAADMRPALELCVANWEAYRAVRQRVLERLRREKLLDANGTILLELGNSGFPRYSYALFARGRFLTGVDTPTGGHEEDVLSADLSTSLLDIKGSASAPVYDGDCYFVTYRADNQWRRVAFYTSRMLEPPVQNLLRIMGRHVDPASERPAVR